MSAPVPAGVAPHPTAAPRETAIHLIAGVFDRLRPMTAEDAKRAAVIAMAAVESQGLGVVRAPR